MGIREAKKASVRERLVDAAAQLFLERGVEGTTMDDIAAAAGTSRTSVFNYFGYKEAILVEIGARYVRAVGEAAQEQAPSAVSTSPLESARASLTALADAIAGIAANEPRLIAAVAREMTHPDPVRRTRAMDRMQYPVLIEGLLRSLDDAHALQPTARVETLIRQLVDLTSGVLVRAAEGLSPDEIRAELRANVDLFCDGAFAADAATAADAAKPADAARPSGTTEPSGTEAARPA